MTKPLPNLGWCTSHIGLKEYVSIVLLCKKALGIKVLRRCWGLLRLIRAHDVLTDICDDHVIWWPRRGWTEWIHNLCTVVITHNDLCTCIAWTKWDGPVVCVNVTENVVNFQSKCYHFNATKASVTVSVKQHEHGRVTCCSFSVNLIEIKTISQSLPSTCAICLQPRQSSHHRGEIETPRLSGTVNLPVRI